MSDLHLEFGEMTENPKPLDGATNVLILAGDITVKARVDWIIDMSRIFEHVIYVPGNHEFYRGDLEKILVKTQAAFNDAEANNVMLLQNENVVIDGVTFHGTTFWTDFDNQNVMTMMRIENALNDYHVIRYDDYTKRFNAKKALIEHMVAKEYLATNVMPRDVVITHHAPSFQSVADDYRAADTNGGYCSNLDDFVAELNPSLWFHGHIHQQMDYFIDKTRILCNPRGYVGYEDTGFDPMKMVVLEDGETHI